MCHDFIEIKDNMLPKDLGMGPVVLIFSANWCGPCRIMRPDLEKLAEEYRGKIRFLYIDTDKNIEISMTYKVKSIPHTVFMKDGTKTHNYSGAMDLGKIEDNLKIITKGDDKVGPNDREEELKKIIRDAQIELDVIKKGMTWSEACELIGGGIDNSKESVTVYSTLNSQHFHGYEGIGIIYDKHIRLGAKDRYRVQ